MSIRRSAKCGLTVVLGTFGLQATVPKLESGPGGRRCGAKAVGMAAILHATLGFFAEASVWILAGIGAAAFLVPSNVTAYVHGRRPLTVAMIAVFLGIAALGYFGTVQEARDRDAIQTRENKMRDDKITDLNQQNRKLLSEVGYISCGMLHPRKIVECFHQANVFDTGQFAMSAPHISSREISGIPQRTLSASQSMALETALRHVTPTTVLVFPLNSNESVIYLRQLENILKKAHWNVEHFLGGDSDAEPTDVIRVGWQGTKSDAFKALTAGLKNAGIKFETAPFELNDMSSGKGDSRVTVSLDVGRVKMNRFQAAADRLR